MKPAHFDVQECLHSSLDLSVGGYAGDVDAAQFVNAGEYGAARYVVLLSHQHRARTKVRHAVADWYCRVEGITLVGAERHARTVGLPLLFRRVSCDRGYGVGV